MSTTVKLGGNRLGSGNKMNVELHGFERSTFDNGFVIRDTMSPGTLVPFGVIPTLPGDTFDINIGADVKTLPTLGPLFGSFKLQIDVFEVPSRLYNSWLHNNATNVGRSMENIMKPYFELECNSLVFHNKYSGDGKIYGTIEKPPLEFQQINQSSVFAHLGIRGIGNSKTEPTVKRKFNGEPWIGYADIYKNFYANKSEGNGYMIHATDFQPELTGVEIFDSTPTQLYIGDCNNINLSIAAATATTLKVTHKTDEAAWTHFSVIVSLNNTTFGAKRELITTRLVVNIDDVEEITDGYIYTGTINETEPLIIWGIDSRYGTSLEEGTQQVQLTEFPLQLIDDLRNSILKIDGNIPFSLSDDCTLFQYLITKLPHPESTYNKAFAASQEGLFVKTYQSDIFNNWLNTEWIDGEGGLNELTRVSTAGGSFSMDTLNITKKLYNYLARIAVSGGTYKDWIEASFDHNAFFQTEIPQYHGGLSKEIIFQEVVQLSVGGEGTPLGTMAGKGGMSSKHKGGNVYIKCNEPGYIIFICSITPRIDYSQGNEFFVNWTNASDIHKPQFSGIGFQDLVTDKMAFWDTELDEEGTPTYKSAGKQPAWLDYMTSYNKIYGNFAHPNNLMFWTLARRYTPDELNEEIADLTTYVDPAKYNYAFANTAISGMNFLVQIACDVTSRRKMSSKLMPNV